MLKFKYVYKHTRYICVCKNCTLYYTSLNKVRIRSLISQDVSID